MTIFPKNNLPTASLNWGREVEKSINNLESGFRTAEVNNVSRDAQLQASYKRLDTAVTQLAATNAAVDQAQSDAITALQAANTANSTANSANAKAIEALEDASAAQNDAIAALQGLGSLDEATSTYKIHAANLTVGSLSGDRISGGTIVGTEILTANSGRRVKLEATQASFWDESNNYTGKIQGAGTDRGSSISIESSGTGRMGVYSGGGYIDGTGGASLTVSGGYVNWTGELNANSNGIRVDNSYIRTSNVIMTNNNLATPASGRVETGTLRLLSPDADFISNANGQMEGPGFRATGNINVAGDLFVSMDSGSGTTVVVDGNNKFLKSSSSERHKQQVEEMPLETAIVSMPLKTFKYNYDVETYGEEAPKLYGYIAEELDAQGLTDFVIYETLEDGTKRPDAVRYDSIFAALHKTVQHQAGVIEALEARLSALEDRVQ